MKPTNGYALLHAAEAGSGAVRSLFPFVSVLRTDEEAGKRRLGERSPVARALSMSIAGSLPRCVQRAGDSSAC